MRRFRSIIIVAAGLLIALALVRTLFAEQIGASFFRQAAERGVTRDVMHGWPEGLHVVTVGTGSPLADPSRAGPMTAVIAGKRIFIVDAGGGAARKFQGFGLPYERVEAVLLTHFHSDHIDGLGEVLLQAWAGGGRASPLPVFGPQGVEPVIDGLKIAYAHDTRARIAHHGAETVIPQGAGALARAFDSKLGTVRLYEEGGVVITAVAVSHEPAAPAVAYRFDYKGRSVTISGDTAKSEALAALARGTDVLVHEALNPDMVADVESALAKAGRKRLAKIMSDIPSYHTSPVDAAETAKAAGAKTLVLTHIVPALPNRFLHAAFLKGTKAVYAGPIVLGEDGMVFSMAANGADVKRSRLK
jgi:ribonuclease Z